MKLFDKCVALTVKFRHFLIVGAILCILAITACWVYLDNIRFATDNTTYAWVVDSAQTVSEPIALDGSFRQSFTTSDPVFGGGFVFTVYDEVCYGTVTLSLEDESGQVLASTSMDTTALYDNTFQQLSFPDGVYPDGETTYTYVLTVAPHPTESGSLGVWISEDAVAGIAPYVLNGETAETCASFAIVTNYAGNFIIPIFFACAAFAAVIIVMGYWLLFIKKARLEVIFIFFALTLGALYMLLFPPYVSPDEEMHIHTAYALSNTLLGIENETYVSLRAGDDISFDKADELDIFSYQNVAQNLFGQCEDSTIVSTEHTIVYTEPLYLYLPTTIGILIARLFNFNYLTLIFCGRAMNLLAYTAIVALGIALMPRFKRIICIVGLLPMSLMLASSFNYDTIVIATAFLYTALVLKTAQGDEPYTWKQLLLVITLGLLLAPMKKLYVFLCCFCAILGLRRCPKLIQKAFWPLVGLGVVVFICLIPTIREMLYITDYFLLAATWTAIPDVNPMNIDYAENLYWVAPYILTHLTTAAKMMLRTVQENTGLYLVQLVGGKAGEYILLDLPIWTPLVGVLYGVLFLGGVPTADEKPLLSPPQKCWSALIFLATTAGLFTVALSWTSLRDSTIWGIQGRYFLPLLPMILLMLQSKLVILRENIERQLLMVLACVNLAAIASVFGQIMTFTHNT